MTDLNEIPWIELDDEDGNVTVSHVPGVLKCICGGHPFPEYPPFDKFIEGHRKNFLICGPERSGSTLIGQIVNEFRPNEVLKTHGMQDSCPLLYDYKGVFCTIRHPFDIMASSIRLNERHKDRVSMGFNNSLNMIHQYIALDHVSPFLSANIPPIWIFRYEDFYNNALSRVRAIACALEISLDTSEENRISKKFSIDSNVERVNQIPDLQDPTRVKTTHAWALQESHIGEMRGKPGQGKNIPDKIKQEIYHNHKKIFDIFGYEYY